MAMRGSLFSILAVSISACSLFHHPTPQQKLFDALNRGNAAEASQIWLGMSQKDRMKFNRGEGITPAVPPEQVVKKLTDMSPDEMQGEVTITPPAAEGSLLDLPKLAQPQAAGPSQPTPQKSQEEP
jgi:hypothetical protein